MKRRFYSLLLLLFCFLPALPCTVLANSPPPCPYYIFQVSNYPEETVYIDLLIPLLKSDDRYVSVIETNMPKGFSEFSEIISYHEEGFCSYTFHYRDALSSMACNRDGNVEFFTDRNANYVSDDNIRYSHADEIFSMGRVRLALLDEWGNILHVSPVLELNSRKMFFSLNNYFYYDTADESFDVLYRDNSVTGYILYIVMSIVGMLMTCVVEYACSIPFGLYNEYAKRIVLTNVVSQIMMYTAYVMLYSVIFWKYRVMLVVLEILVYLGETAWYTKSIQKYSRKRIVAYTLIANTASLFVGTVMIYPLIF